MEKTNTRKDEIRYITSDPKRMLNRFICRDVVKKWNESFLLENGEITDVERSELLFQKGTYIDHDIHAKIRFYMAAGDIKEVEVSNQNRKGVLLENNFLHLYKATASIADKKQKFLLYATSINNANDILTDYIELNRHGGFFITKIEETENCYVIIDKVDIETAQEAIDRAYIKDQISGEEYSSAQVDITGIEPDFTKMNFYLIISRIIQQDTTTEFEENKQTFIVQTYTASRANILIEQKIREIEEKRYDDSLKHPDRTHEKREVSSYIEECKVLPINTFIPREFSVAYFNDDEK